MKPIVRTALLIPAALALAACLGGGDDASPALPDYVTKVLDIDREEGTVRMRDYYYYCDGEELVHDSDTYEENYAIEDGKLYWMWGEDACMADVYTGSSSDVVGTWKADPPALETISTSPYCEEEIAERTLINSFSRNLNVTYKVSETQIVMSGSGEPCVAEAEAWWMGMGSGEEIEATASKCNSVTLTRVSDDATATITGGLSGGKSKVTFKSGNQTCTGTLPLNDSEPQDCTDGGADAVFYGCVAATGFFGEGVLEKNAAAKAARKHRALRALRASR